MNLFSFLRRAAPGLILSCLLNASAVLAAPEDFNAVPGYGSEIPWLTADKNDVAVEDIAVASETTDPDGRKRLSFTAKLHNMGRGYFQTAQIRFEPPVAGGSWDVQIVDEDALIADLPPNSTVALPEPIIMIAPAATAEAMKAQVLSGVRLRPHAVELYQFRLPPVPVDQATVEAYEGAVGIPFTNNATLTFSETTPLLASLQPGRLLMETTMTYVVPRAYADSDDRLLGFAALVSIAERYGDKANGQLRTTRMVEVTSVTIHQDGTVSVGGICFGGEVNNFNPFNPLPQSYAGAQNDPRFRGMIDNLAEGTMVATHKDAFDSPDGRNVFDPQVGLSMFTDYETVRRAEEAGELREHRRVRHARMADLGGFFVMHLPVNDLQITKCLTLDGEILLDGLNISIETRFSLGALRRVSLSLTGRVEMNLRITAGPGASNSDKPEFERETQIANIPGPFIVFSLFSVPIKIQPVFQVKAGVTVDVPMAVVIPFTGSYEAGLQMIWDGTRPPTQQVTFEPISKIRPLGISKPQLADSLALELGAYLEAQLSLIVNDLAGPFIALRVNGGFTANPLANPWWNMNAGLTIRGGFKLTFFGVDLAEVASELFQGPQYELFRRDAGGMPAGGSGLPGGAPPGPYDPVEGDKIRWAKIHVNSDPHLARVVRVAGSAEDVFMIVKSFTVTPPICRLDAKGEVMWSVGSWFVNPEAIASTPDGGVMVLSKTNSSLLTLINGAGVVQWTKSVRPVNNDNSQRLFSVTKVVVSPIQGGDYEVYVAGSVNNGTTLDNDPIVMKFNSAGDLIWNKVFPSTNMTETINDALMLQDGNLLLCGSARGNSDGSPIGPGATEGGLLMKVTPQGGLEWAVRSNPAAWYSAVQAPDGRIFTAGSFLPIVSADIPAFMVGSYDTSGQVIQIVTVCEANRNDKVSGLYGGFEDHLPNSGFTPYDYAIKVVWTPAGLMAAGATGLGNQRAPWNMLFTEKLSLRWCVVHEGVNVEDIFDMATTEDGVLTVGKTHSFGAAAGQNTASTMLLKLPFDGTVPLHKRAQAQVKYLQPSVYDFTGGNWDIDVPSPDVGYDKTEPVTFAAAANLPIVPGDLPTFPYETTPSYVTTRIDRGLPSNPMTYDQWAAYQQISGMGAGPEGNFDGDGLTNYEEYLFGGDPWSYQSRSTSLFNVSRQADGTGVRLLASRTHASRGSDLVLDRSNDLVTWTPLQSTAGWDLSEDDRLDLVTGTYYLDLDTAPGERGFFMLHEPAAPAEP